MIINDVTMFSTLQEVADAAAGKYSKDYQKSYKLTLIKNVCFVNTVESCTIKDLPDHYAFKYYDDSGWHNVNEGAKSVTVNDVSCFFFVIKNT